MNSSFEFEIPSIRVTRADESENCLNLEPSKLPASIKHRRRHTLSALSAKTNTTKTILLMRTVEKRVVGEFQGKTLRGRISNKERRCNLQDVSKYIRQRRKYWNNLVERMYNKLRTKTYR